jgi:DNA mismatch repair protein MutS
VPNDLTLTADDSQILIVTGPNMAGKSTYLRQAALVVIMAQMGSFVPAEAADIGVVDRIFTRIGAGDNLAAGASTFLVEMQEVANILNNATGRSLVILDEVGRGTSTYDGLAVAWAVIEYLSSTAEKAGPKVLFATHYFELTSLARANKNVQNYHAAVREWKRPDGETDIVFLHQILPGPADRSYGVHVAQMAGLPEACTARAKTILKSLEAQAEKSADQALKRPAKKVPAEEQLPLLAEHPLIEDIKKIDPAHMTPFEALTLLNQWNRSLNGPKNQQGDKTHENG